MSQNEPPPSAAVLQILTGAWLAQAVGEVARLGVADLLADGPKAVASIAATLGVDADALHRVLRATAAAGIFRLRADGTVDQTERSATLRGDAPGSPRWYATFMAHPAHRAAWSELRHSVATGRPAFDHVHGAGFFEHCRKDAELARIFDESMTALSRQEHAAVASAYDFTRFGTIVDVGGGHGGLLSTILAAAPAAHGVLFDQPHVVAGAGPTLAAAGTAERVTTVGGDFFASVPAGGDAYVMGHIVHDWDDEGARRILRNVRSAAAPGAKLLLFENVLPDAADDRPCLAKLLDLEMLVMTRGGRERTEAEYAALLASAGFRQERVVRTPCETQIVESVAA